ncbi:hypothetical protein CEXT_579281 [Caerostris extrusa]|uniref:Uncharacterized protein n=1 Tax=Caerostris extrusa TaxID=172846 RepID=A0AAV4XEX6_CAEEX|nr:hypothetical protein CEXT_579281 [Caerostris extrusa]
MPSGGACILCIGLITNKVYHQMFTHVYQNLCDYESFKIRKQDTLTAEKSVQIRVTPSTCYKPCGVGTKRASLFRVRTLNTFVESNVYN